MTQPLDEQPEPRWSEPGRREVDAGISVPGETPHDLDIHATLAGTKERDLPREWSRYDGPQPDSEQTQRLVFAWEQWRKVSELEGDDVARAWFIGANLWLDERAPVTAIREGKMTEVRVAVHALIDDSWSG